MAGTTLGLYKLESIFRSWAIVLVLSMFLIAGARPALAQSAKGTLTDGRGSTLLSFSHNVQDTSGGNFIFVGPRFAGQIAPTWYYYTAGVTRMIFTAEGSNATDGGFTISLILDKYVSNIYNASVRVSQKQSPFRVFSYQYQLPVDVRVPSLSRAYLGTAR
jgi:hypothetical protein